MKRVQEKDGTVRWEYDVIYVDGKEEMQYVRAYTSGLVDKDGKYVGYVQVYEKPDGSFVTQNGQPVKDKALFTSMPEGHRERALLWFDTKWNEIKVTEDAEKTVVVDSPPMP